MKKILITLVVFISLTAQGQTDSSRIYLKNIQFQARDLESLVAYITNDEQYEDMYLLVAAKFRATQPSGNTVVTIDSVRADALIGIGMIIRQLPYTQVGQAFLRIDAAVKASPYIIRHLSDYDTLVNDNLLQQRQEGRRRLRGIRN